MEGELQFQKIVELVVNGRVAKDDKCMERKGIWYKKPTYAIPTIQHCGLENDLLK